MHDGWGFFFFFFSRNILSKTFCSEQRKEIFHFIVLGICLRKRVSKLMVFQTGYIWLVLLRGSMHGFSNPVLD